MGVHSNPARVSRSHDRSRHLHHFDIATALVALVVLGSLYTVRDQMQWQSADIFIAAAFCLTLAGVVLRREQAYSQRTPWLAGAFSVSSLAAGVVLLSRLSTVLWLGAVAVVSALLMSGLIVRTKRVSEPIQARDVAKALAVLASVGLAILACEAALRIVPRFVSPEVQRALQADPGKYGVAHPYVGHLQTPHYEFEVASASDFRQVHRTGDHGFPNASAWPDHADIVVVGDSLVFGYGVPAEGAWPAILGRTLAPARVMNLGLIGGGPQQYQRVYETFGAMLRPRLLLLGLFTGNDFSNAATFESWLKSGAGGNFMVWRDFGRPVRVPLSLRTLPSTLDYLSRAYLYPWLRRSHLFNLTRLVFDDDDAGASEGTLTYDFADGRKMRLDPARLEAVASTATRGAAEFELTMDALEGARRVAAEGAAQFLVVIQPSKEEVYLPLLGRPTPDTGESLRLALERAGIDYVDTTPTFRQRAARGERLFFDVDGHPNAAGYSLIAESVITYIRERSERYRLPQN